MKGGTMKRLLETSNDFSLTIARLGLGIMILPHGAQKLLGAFGGPGFEATMGAMTGKMHIPAIFALLAIIAEFFGGLGLILGALGRVAAFGVGVTMVVAVVTTHFANGFFMNWMGSQKGEGWEFHLLAIALAVVVTMKGAGALSIDRLFVREQPVA
jgi:putative oxidoreductase